MRNYEVNCVRCENRVLSIQSLVLLSFPELLFFVAAMKMQIIVYQSSREKNGINNWLKISSERTWANREFFFSKQLTYLNVLYWFCNRYILVSIWCVCFLFSLSLHFLLLKVCLSYLWVCTQLNNENRFSDW